MTSNPRFAQYVERVQQNLAVFSISDSNARNFLRKSDSIANYQPDFLVFEILINHRPTDSQPTRMFDPHVSSKLLEGITVESAAWYLELLDANTEVSKRQGKPIDWQNIDWSMPDDEEVFSDLGEEIEELFLIHERTQGKHKEHAEKIVELKQESEKVDPQSNRADLEKAVSSLRKLVRRYEREYIPTNLAASALIYEAWKLGNLKPLGNPEEDEDTFDRLLEALFIYRDKESNEEILPKMASDLGIPYLEKEGVSRLHNGDVWANYPPEPWFTCVENSLIYQLLIDETPKDTYVIHFPLILDNYRFVGFCYLFVKKEYEKEMADIFIRGKYSKFYCVIQSVSDTLKLSLQADALQRVNKLLEQGEDDPEVLFAEAVKDYFVCFDVISEKQYLPDDVERDLLNDSCLYEGHGIKIYGPSWVSDEHKSILFNELEGVNKKQVSELPQTSSISGLYQEVRLRIKRFQDKRKEGKEDQAGLFSHQAAGLVSEVWCDKGMRELTRQSQGCLWQLKTLIDVWGNFDLEPNETLRDGPQDYPHFWLQLSHKDLVNELINTGIVHALRRSTYRRSGAENPHADEITRLKAFEIRRSPNRIDLFKGWVGLEVNISHEVYPDWISYRGFILCFHHCFWQAAFHGFQARCGYPENLQENRTANRFVTVEIAPESVTIYNRRLLNSSFASSSSAMPRDIRFYEENLFNRINASFQIDGPRPTPGSNETWRVVIIPS